MTEITGIIAPKYPNNKTKLHKKDPVVNLENIKNALEADSHTNVHKIVYDMDLEMKEANTIRNSTTHSFSKLNPDGRSSISADGRTYGGGTGHKTSFDDQVRILRKSLKAISIFMQSIRLELINKGFDLDSMED